MPSMVTAIELAERLKGVSVEDVCKESGLSAKTIYRLRHRKNSPTLDTVEILLKAIDKIEARQRDAAKAAA
jgi:transcriptional regulator with XRE-family HTH domain